MMAVKSEKEPQMLSKNHIVLGVIYLKDIIKDGVKD